MPGTPALQTGRMLLIASIAILLLPVGIRTLSGRSATGPRLLSLNVAPAAAEPTQAQPPEPVLPVAAAAQPPELPIQFVEAADDFQPLHPGNPTEFSSPSAVPVTADASDSNFGRFEAFAESQLSSTFETQPPPEAGNLIPAAENIGAQPTADKFEVSGVPQTEPAGPLISISPIDFEDAVQTSFDPRSPEAETGETAFVNANVFAAEEFAAEIQDTELAPEAAPDLNQQAAEDTPRLSTDIALDVWLDEEPRADSDRPEPDQNGQDRPTISSLTIPGFAAPTADESESEENVADQVSNQSSLATVVLDAADTRPAPPETIAETPAETAAEISIDSQLPPEPYRELSIPPAVFEHTYEFSETVEAVVDPRVIRPVTTRSASQSASAGLPAARPVPNTPHRPQTVHRCAHCQARLAASNKQSGSSGQIRSQPAGSTGCHRCNSASRSVRPTQSAAQQQQSNRFLHRLSAIVRQSLNARTVD